jgi:hypothetical protein
MSLSIEQVAKLTKLSVARVRAYTSTQHLGTKVGSRRVYSQADVKKLVKISEKNPATAKRMAMPPKPKHHAAPRKRTRKQASLGKEKTALVAPPISVTKPQKKPFWSFLFPRAKQGKKVSLLEVKSPK